LICLSAPCRRGGLAPALESHAARPPAGPGWWCFLGRRSDSVTVLLSAPAGLSAHALTYARVGGPAGPRWNDRNFARDGGRSRFAPWLRVGGRVASGGGLTWMAGDLPPQPRLKLAWRAWAIGWPVARARSGQAAGGPSVSIFCSINPRPGGGLAPRPVPSSCFRWQPPHLPRGRGCFSLRRADEPIPIQAHYGSGEAPGWRPRTRPGRPLGNRKPPPATRILLIRAANRHAALSQCAPWP